MRSIFLLDIECRISSIFLGRLTIFKKAILKPLSLGIELRVVEKLLLTFFRSELLQITGVTVGIHISGT